MKQIRAYASTAELQEIAETASNKIAIRTMDGGNSHDEWRGTTKAEKKVLYATIYGALLALNTYSARCSAEAAQGIIDGAEYTADLLTDSLLKDDEQCNGYMSVYIPLQDAVEAWQIEQ